MREHAALAHQAVALVHIHIVERRGEEGAQALDLGRVLGEMRVQQHARVTLKEGACGAELCGGAGDGEARRHRVAEPPHAVPAFDEPGAGDDGVRAIEQRRRHVAVSKHLARDQARPPALGGPEQRFGRNLVARGEDQRGRGAMREGKIEEPLGARRRVIGVREGCLGGKRVAFEPVHELRAIASDDVHLGEVDMGVDEAGQDDGWAQVLAGIQGATLRHEVGGAGCELDASAVQRQHTVLDVLHGIRAALRRRRGEAHERAPNQLGRHRSAAPISGEAVAVQEQGDVIVGALGHDELDGDARVEALDATRPEPSAALEDQGIGARRQRRRAIPGADAPVRVRHAGSEAFALGQGDELHAQPGRRQALVQIQHMGGKRRLSHPRPRTFGVAAGR